MTSPFHRYLSTFKDLQKEASVPDNKESCRLSGWNYGALFIHFVFPLVASGMLSVLGIGIEERSNFISVVSIITGLMCAVATMLFEVRANTMKGKKYLSELDDRAVDELYYLTIWIVVVGIIISLLLILPDFDWGNNIPDACTRAYSLICVYLILHFTLSIVSFAERMISVYVRIAEERL